MCNYCGCRDITVVGRFMTEHEHIVNHLGAQGDSLRDVERRRQATLTLGAHLLPHTGSEEVGLFPRPPSTSGAPSGTRSTT